MYVFCAFFGDRAKVDGSRCCCFLLSAIAEGVPIPITDHVQLRGREGTAVAASDGNPVTPLTSRLRESRRLPLCRLRRLR